MKIYIFEMEPWEQEALRDLEREHELVYLEESLTPENAGRFTDAEIISTFIYSKLGSQTLEQLPNLRMIATRSTGVDHIDQNYCRHHDITVSNVPNYGKNTVAEHTFGLMLAISHRIVEAADRTCKGEFTFKGLLGFDLQGKILGVIGTGDIGESVIEIANGFRMKVLAFDVKPNDELARRLHFDYVSMDTMLEKSDIITVHVPEIPQTHHMISTDQFSKMKDGMVLINTSRGNVVDIQALAQALANGKIKAAGLDVVAEEPVMREEAELLRSVYQNKHQNNLASLLANNVLIRLRNVIVTPHSAFYTTEAITRILTATVENIAGFIKGNPKNVK